MTLNQATNSIISIKTSSFVQNLDKHVTFLNFEVNNYFDDFKWILKFSHFRVSLQSSSSTSFCFLWIFLNAVYHIIKNLLSFLNKLLSVQVLEKLKRFVAFLFCENFRECLIKKLCGAKEKFKYDFVPRVLFS
jgi:hypothetical protein